MKLNRKRITLVAAMTCATFSIALVGKSEEKTTSQHIKTKIVEKSVSQRKLKSMSLEDSIYSYMQEINLKFPKVALAQARLESGNFRSRLFREDFNMFGMKTAQRRVTLSKSEPGQYAEYHSWKESVIDYALYQSTYHFKVKSQREYIDQVCESYSENPKYKTVLLEVIDCIE